LVNRHPIKLSEVVTNPASNDCVGCFGCKCPPFTLINQHQPAHETPELIPKQHIISISTGQPFLREWKDNDRFKGKQHQAGDVFLLTANQAVKHRWFSEVEMVHLYLDTTQFAQTACEPPGTDTIELLPQIGIHDPLIQNIGAALKSEAESGDRLHTRPSNRGNVAGGDGQRTGDESLVQLPFYLQQLFNANASQSGLAIALTTLSYQRLKARFTFTNLYTIAFVLMGIGYLMISAAPSYPIVLMGLAIGGLDVGLLMPNMNVCLTSSTPVSLRGRILGGLTTSFFLGQFISPLISQPLSLKVGLGATYGLAGGLMWVMAIASVVVTLQQRSGVKT
jgi:hypothetical protein